MGTAAGTRDWQALEQDIRQRLLSTPESADMGDPADLYDAESCPRCATFRCAGIAAWECNHWLTMLAACQTDHHTWCEDWWCDFPVHIAPAVLAKGLPHATPNRPLVVVALDESQPDDLAVHGTYERHQQAKPARTRAGGGGWAAKGRAWVVCGRCEALH